MVFLGVKGRDKYFFPTLHRRAGNEPRKEEKLRGEMSDLFIEVFFPEPLSSTSILSAESSCMAPVRERAAVTVGELLCCPHAPGTGVPGRQPPPNSGLETPREKGEGAAEEASRSICLLAKGAHTPPGAGSCSFME